MVRTHASSDGQRSVRRRGDSFRTIKLYYSKCTSVLLSFDKMS
jgi:hypothetical protein